MSRTSPSRVNLLTKDPSNLFIYGNMVGGEIGTVSSTLSLVDEVYRVDIEKSGVLGVASEGNFRGVRSVLKTIGAEVKLLRSKDTEISEESINELSEAGLNSLY